MYIYMCVYIYIYIHIYTHINKIINTYRARRRSSAACQRPGRSLGCGQMRSLSIYLSMNLCIYLSPLVLTPFVPFWIALLAEGRARMQ